MKATLEKIQNLFKQNNQTTERDPIEKFQRVENLFMKMDSFKTTQLDWRTSFLRTKSADNKLENRETTKITKRREGYNESSAN